MSCRPEHFTEPLSLFFPCMRRRRFASIADWVVIQNCWNCVTNSIALSTQCDERYVESDHCYTKLVFQGHSDKKSSGT
jgi:hypothetical protein